MDSCSWIADSHQPAASQGRVAPQMPAGVYCDANMFSSHLPSPGLHNDLQWTDCKKGVEDYTHKQKMEARGREQETEIFRPQAYRPLAFPVGRGPHDGLRGGAHAGLAGDAARFMAPVIGYPVAAPMAQKTFGRAENEMLAMAAWQQEHAEQMHQQLLALHQQQQLALHQHQQQIHTCTPSLSLHQMMPAHAQGLQGPISMVQGTQENFLTLSHEGTQNVQHFQEPGQDNGQHFLHINAILGKLVRSSGVMMPGMRGARQPNMRLGHLRNKKREKNKPQDAELDQESPNNTRQSGISESSMCESNSRTAGQLQQPSSSQLEGDGGNDNDNACVDIDSTDAGSAGGIGASEGNDGGGDVTGADTPGPQMPIKTKTQAQKLRTLKRKHKDVGVEALEEESNQVRGGQPLLPQEPTGHVPSSQPPPSPGPKDVPMRCAMGTQKQDGAGGEAGTNPLTLTMEAKGRGDVLQQPLQQLQQPLQQQGREAGTNPLTLTKQTYREVAKSVDSDGLDGWEREGCQNRSKEQTHPSAAPSLAQLKGILAKSSSFIGDEEGKSVETDVSASVKAMTGAAAEASEVDDAEAEGLNEAEILKQGGVGGGGRGGGGGGLNESEILQQELLAKLSTLEHRLATLEVEHSAICQHFFGFLDDKQRQESIAAIVRNYSTKP